MSGLRAAAEPYATRFESEVTAVDDRRVWLESTHFFAASGGQPADSGTVGDVPVEDVRFVDGDVVHVLGDEPTVRAGSRVLCSVDWSKRMYNMRAHTAAHVCYGAARRVLDDLEYVGLDIGPERVRVELESSTRIDDELLVALDERINRVVWESRPVSWESVPLREARERGDVLLTDAIEDEAFSNGQVRLVTIGEVEEEGPTIVNATSDPWDVAACGGTHVRNTREIGPVTVLGLSRLDGGVTGIELAVGPRAIDRRETEKRLTFAASRQLGVPLAEASDELSRLDAERRELVDAVGTLQRELVRTRLESAEPFERDGRTWIASVAGVVDSTEAGEVAESLAGQLADVVVIAGDEGSPFAAVATDGSADATEILEELTDEFGGGGGGSEALAWGGDFDVPAEDVIAAIR